MKKLHGPEAVRSMTLQIYTDYHLPVHPMDLSWDLMKYFYEPLIPGLLELGKLRYAKGKK